MVAIGVGLVTALIGGRAVVFVLERLPEAWRRTVQWLIVIGAGLGAVVVDFWSPGPGGEGVFVFVVAALPGLIAYLAWRTMLASALVSLLPLYFAIAAMVADRPLHVPAIALDRALPLRPGWMLAYGSLYVFVLLPVLVVRDQQLFRRAMQSYLTVMLIAYAGFLAYPTVSPRPRVVTDAGFAAWCLRLNYALDSAYNCFPSLHVAHSFVSALTSYRVHRGVGYVATTWAVLIAVSTLYTKQHYFVDAVAGMLIAGIAYVVFLRHHPQDAIAERDRRRAPQRALVVVAVFAILIACLWVVYRSGIMPAGIMGEYA